MIRLVAKGNPDWRGDAWIGLGCTVTGVFCGALIVIMTPASTVAFNEGRY